MKKLALGMVTAAALVTAAAAPAMAFGVHVGVGPVGIGVGAPGPYYNGCGYNYPCGGGYYDYYDGPSVAIGDGGWHGHGHWHGHAHHR